MILREWPLDFLSKFQGHSFTLHRKHSKASMMPIIQRLIHLMDLILTFQFTREEKTWKIHFLRLAEKISILWDDCRPPGMSNSNDQFCINCPECFKNSVALTNQLSDSSGRIWSTEQIFSALLCTGEDNWPRYCSF